MATEDKEIQHECYYCGTHDANQLKGKEFRLFAPSPGFAREIALAILGGQLGKYHSPPHFRERMLEREFDVFDMEYAIRNGKCIGAGEACEEFRSYKYTFRANIEGTNFDAVFALLADHDYKESPTIVLITGCFKTKTGRRKTRY